MTSTMARACIINADQDSDGDWRATCPPHGTAGPHESTSAEALAAFACDRGQHLRFVVAISYGDLGTPHTAMRTLSGLLHDIRETAPWGGLTAWRWIGDGTTQPVTIRRSADGTALIAELNGDELVRAEVAA